MSADIPLPGVPPFDPLALVQLLAARDARGPRGAEPTADGTRLSVWAPKAKRVVARVLTGAAKGDHELARARDRGHEIGVYASEIAGLRAGDEYGYVLDSDDRVVPDPVSRWLPRGVHGPTRVVDWSAFAWNDSDWRGVAMRDLAIYEIHVGTFTPEGNFDAVVPRLAALRALGVTAIELMPVAQFPGERNWGYDGVSYYAVQDSYGGPDGLRRLVNAAHANGLAVILDAVYNHLGPEGNYLDAFGPYHTTKYTTPWGPALNYDDAGSDEVRRYVVENARHWITEYHIDGLRLDAVHGIFDFSATHLLEEIATTLHDEGERLGRNVVVIGESDLNDPRLVRDVEQYGYGLDGQWSDDFHHAVHASLTGERTGYYADYGDVRAVARALEEPFVYAGHYSNHRRRRHGAPSVGIPRERFVVAVQNHDQVGNRAAGDRLTTLLEPAQVRVAASLLLLSPYVPLLFMGEEYGETNPFLYFVSHSDEALVHAVREGRRREFESFGWGSDVPDPQSADTFERSRIDWARRDQAAHAAILALHRDLLQLRAAERALRPDGATVSVDHDAHGGIVLLREVPDSGDGFVALFNLSGDEREIALHLAPEGKWALRFDSERAEYGGSSPAPEQVIVPRREVAADEREPRSLFSEDGANAPRVRLAPWSAALYERGSPR